MKIRQTASWGRTGAIAFLVACSPQVAPPEKTSTPTTPAPVSAQSIKGTPAGTMMTKEYLAAVGRIAYIWGWRPLVNNRNRAVAMANLPEPGRMGGIVPVAPPGRSRC